MSINTIMAASAAEVRRRDRDEDWGFMSLTGSSLYTLINFNRQEILDDINRMYIKNPIAARIVKAKTNYVVGDGFNFKAVDDTVQKLLEDYWERNEWNIKRKYRFHWTR